MIHQHNHSTLLNDKRKAVYYPPTGTGRDSYIMTDNGGTNSIYKCQGAPELGNYMKFGHYNRSYKPVSHTRFQKYISDGSGRDKYVVSHHGGQYNEEDQCNSTLRKFTKTLRDGDAGWGYKFSQTTKGEGFIKTKESVVRERALSCFQRDHSRKLSAPKKLNEKYQLKLNFLRNRA